MQDCHSIFELMLGTSATLVILCFMFLFHLASFQILLLCAVTCTLMNTTSLSSLICKLLIIVKIK